MKSVLVTKYIVKWPWLKALDSFELKSCCFLICWLKVVIPGFARLLHVFDIVGFHFSNQLRHKREMIVVLLECFAFLGIKQVITGY
jgi:hypothetical protein